MKKQVLVAGGTGLVGGLLIQQLISKDEIEKIFVITRRPLAIEHSKIVPLNADFANLEVDLQPLPKLDAVFCCLGTTIKKAGSQQSFREVDFDFVLSLGKWAKTSEVSRFLVVSSQGAIVGVVRVRHHINTDFLAEEVGHIGYDVPPTHRRRGFGVAVLKAGLARAREIGLERVLLYADTDNPASWRTIERCGGVFDAERYSPLYNCLVRRYWITVPPPQGCCPRT